MRAISVWVNECLLTTFTDPALPLCTLPHTPAHSAPARTLPHTLHPPAHSRTLSLCILLHNPAHSLHLLTHSLPPSLPPRLPLPATLHPSPRCLSYCPCPPHGCISGDPGTLRGTAAAPAPARERSSSSWSLTVRS